MPKLKRKVTDQKIMIGFEKLLKQESFSSITINEISNSAGVHRNTIYQHYQDKFAILKAYCKFKIKGLPLEAQAFIKTPFTIIYNVYYHDMHDITKHQDDNAEFQNTFELEFYRNMCLQSETNQFLTELGYFCSVWIWNQLNENKLNLRKDYQKLDEYYQKKQLPELK